MAGQGSPGHCKLCASPYADAINKMIADGKNSTHIKRVLQEIGADLTFSRPTLYLHKEHITHPLVSLADEARKNPVVIPQTNRGALEMIRDAGMRQIAKAPSLITPDHTLKALSILESGKRPHVENILVLMAKAMTQESSDEVIIGEYQVIEEDMQPNV